jgi:hypothetical protein
LYRNDQTITVSTRQGEANFQSIQIKDQYYVHSHTPETDLGSVMASLDVEVISYSQRYGYIVLSSPSAVHVLRQQQIHVRVRKRPHKHKLQPALRRLLRNNTHATGPVKLYAVVAVPASDMDCDAVDSPAANYLVSQLRAVHARTVSGCKVAVEVPPGSSVQAASDSIAANPQVG